jgi:hypothetical protein
MLPRIETPEERELTGKLTELAALEAQLTERELDLATLQSELRVFEARYLRAVGRLFAELDELRAQFSEAEARGHPHDQDQRRRATEARTQANASAEAVSTATVTDDVEFHPGDDLKTLYRQIAKLVHPDLSTSEIDRARRNRFMAEANRAYSQGDESKLRGLLDEWESSPESVPGDGVGAELVRTIRKIHQVKARLVVIDSAIADLRRSDLFALKERADESARNGRDLLAQMATQLKAEIANVRQEMQTERTS